MPHSTNTARLGDAVQALRALGIVPAIADPLTTKSGAAMQSIRDSIIDDVPAFTASGNPDVLPELTQHLKELGAEVCRLLSGRPIADFAFVREHAKRRAGQKFPLDAELASYQCTQRVFADWIRDAAVQAADDSTVLRRVVAAAARFAAEYTTAISAVITSEYVSHTRLAAKAEGDRRTELLNLLLHGYDESDSRAALLLRRSGYLEQRQSFCVATARSVDPREMLNAARAERMEHAVAEALSNLPIRVLVGTRDNLVIIVMSGTRRLSGWTAPQSLLADRVYPHLRMIGPAALIGVSSDAPSTSHIPAALSEAKLALDFASVGDRVVRHGSIPFRNMLVSVAAERMQSALPRWMDAFLIADRKARGALTTTLKAYADADMNTLKTAKALSLHPNTIYARMQKINDITDRNPLHYNALTELLLATECAALVASNPRIELHP